MKANGLVGGFALTGGVFSIGLREVPALLFSRRARRAVRGVVILRRVYEYVVVMAALEGVQPTARPYYDAYVDALTILSARATSVAKAL
jgi:hypothetical protein